MKEKIDEKVIEVSPDEAAEMLGLSTRTVRNLISRRVLKAKKVSGKWFIRKDSVDAHLESQPEKEQQESKPSRRFMLEDLSSWRLCLQVFDKMEDSQSNDLLIQRLSSLKIDVLQSIAGGFYSFGEQKLRCYQEAKKSVGSIVGLSKAYRERLQISDRDLDFLEKECIPSLGNLIRKMEKTR